MPHTPKLIAKEQKSDTCLCVLARCCDEPATDTWYTFQEIHLSDPTAIQLELRDHLANAQAKHEAMLAARSLIDSIIIEG